MQSLAMIGVSQGARLDALIIGRGDSGRFPAAGWFRERIVYIRMLVGTSWAGEEDWEASERQYEWRTREPRGVRSPHGWASNDRIQLRRLTTPVFHRLVATRSAPPWPVISNAATST